MLASHAAEYLFAPFNSISLKACGMVSQLSPKRNDLRRHHSREIYKDWSNIPEGKLIQLRIRKLPGTRQGQTILFQILSICRHSTLSSNAAKDADSKLTAGDIAEVRWTNDFLDRVIKEAIIPMTHEEHRAVYLEAISYKAKCECLDRRLKNSLSVRPLMYTLDKRTIASSYHKETLPTFFIKPAPVQMGDDFESKLTPQGANGSAALSSSFHRGKQNVLDLLSEEFTLVDWNEAKNSRSRQVSLSAAASGPPKIAFKVNSELELLELSGPSSMIELLEESRSSKYRPEIPPVDYILPTNLPIVDAPPMSPCSTSDQESLYQRDDVLRLRDKVQALKSNKTVKNVVLGIMDSGMCPKSSSIEFKNRDYEFKTFVTSSDGSVPSDENEGFVHTKRAHGTSVASLAAGNESGIATNAKVRVAQVFHESSTSSSGTASTIQSALEWLIGNNEESKPASNRCDVINMSFSYASSSFYSEHPVSKPILDSFFQDVINTVADRGIHIVASVGNVSGESGKGKSGSPADHEPVIAVGALRHKDTSNWEFEHYSAFCRGESSKDPDKSHFKGFVPETASFGSVFTRVSEGKLGEQIGTSFASPIVAGVLAELLSRTSSSISSRDDAVALLKSLGSFPEEDSLGSPPHDGLCVRVTT